MHRLLKWPGTSYHLSFLEAFILAPWSRFETLASFTAHTVPSLVEWMRLEVHMAWQNILTPSQFRILPISYWKLVKRKTSRISKTTFIHFHHNQKVSEKELLKKEPREKKLLERELKEHQGKLIEQNLLKAITKSLENPGKVRVSTRIKKKISKF